MSRPPRVRFYVEAFAAGGVVLARLTERPCRQIQKAEMISRAKAIGPCGMVWLTCSSHPKATSSSSAGHDDFFATNKAMATSKALANTAQEPVRLMKEPTPPTQVFTQVS